MRPHVRWMVAAVVVLEVLGTQGDPWDTQWHMFMALVGASVAMLVLSRVHARSMARLA